MNEDFAYLIKKLGPPDRAEKCDPETLEQWQGRLPSGLLELWQEYGFGSWDNTRFQLCRPQTYAGLVKLMLDRDPQFDPAVTHMFGFGAFGKLLLWNEKHTNLKIDLPYLNAIADINDAGWKMVESNIAMSAILLEIGNAKQFSLFDNSGAPIFNKCVKRCGNLAMGECFGLFPALALGGSTDIASVKRVKALEHFSLLAQLGPIKMVIPKLNGRTETIRELGAQE